MALPSSGQISMFEIYGERWGDGQLPASHFTIAGLLSDWNLSADEKISSFHGKGRPEGNTRGASNVTSTTATFTGDIYNAGGYSGVNCSWRFRYRPTSSSSWNYTSEGTKGGNFTGQVTEDVSGLLFETQYEVQLQLSNFHDGGAWQTMNTQTFTTKPL